jgi:hypothetical protein
MRCDLGYASLRLRDVAQRDQENSRVLFVECSIEIGECTFLVFQHFHQKIVIRCASRHLASSGNPRDILWRGECLFVERSCPHRTAAPQSIGLLP